MDEENLTPDTLPEVADVTTPDGEQGTVDTVVETLTLEELNEHLGKRFKTKEGALKSLKDTYSFVGKPKEATSTEDVQSLKTEMFFLKNPDYAGKMKPVLETFAKANGISLEEASQLKDFKETHEAYKLLENQKTTVMPSSARQAVPKDRDTRVANARGDATEMAKIVLEGFSK